MIDTLGDGRCAMGFSSHFDVLAADEEMTRAIVLTVYTGISAGFQQYFETVAVGSCV